MVSVNSLWTFIVVILVVALLLWLAHYVIGNVVTDAGLARILRVVVVVLAVLIIIGALLSLGGFVGGPVLVP